MRTCHFFVTFILLFSLVGCTAVDQYYILDKDYLKRRQIETRRFETKSEELVLQSAMYVLQDLGFNLKESSYELGYLLATKGREADNLTVNRTTDIALTALDILSIALSNGRTSTYSGTVYDVSQQIYAVLVTSKSKNNVGFNVRANFTRVICNNEGRCRYEQIGDEDIYQEFFDKLGHSLFLTAHDI